jgi:hypothetical protein
MFARQIYPLALARKHWIRQQIVAGEVARAESLSEFLKVHHTNTALILASN